MTLTEAMTKEITTTLKENSMPIGLGSMGLGFIQQKSTILLGVPIAETLMSIVATITTVGGALVVLLTLALKAKQAYDVFIAKKKDVKDEA